MPSANLLVSAQSPGITISGITTTASSSVLLPAIGETVLISNVGASEACVSIGAGSQTATVPSTTAVQTGMSVLAGSQISLRIPSDSIQQISAITPSGTTTLRVYVSAGQ